MDPVFALPISSEVDPPSALSATPSLRAMYEDTATNEHHVGQPWGPSPSSLQQESQQTTTNLPLIAAILGIIVVVSLVLGLVGWACKLHRRKARWAKEKDLEKAAVRDQHTDAVESAEVERRDSDMTAVGDDETPAKKVEGNREAKEAGDRQEQTINKPAP